MGHLIIFVNEKGLHVSNGSDDSFHSDKLRVQAKQQNHEKEADCPELRPGHESDSSRVGDEGEAGSGFGNFRDRETSFLSHEAKDSENREAGDEGSTL